MKVSEIMSKKVLCLDAKEPIWGAISKLEKYDYKEAPVLENGKYKGMFVLYNLSRPVRVMEKERVEKYVVQVPKLSPDDDLEEVIRIMAESGVLGLPVLEGEKVVGIVSDFDVLKHVKLEGKVHEYMRKGVPTISPEENVGRARRLMAEHNLNRLPVVKEGKYLGQVTLVDTLRVLAGFKRIDLMSEGESVTSFPIKGLVRPGESLLPEEDINSAIKKMLNAHVGGMPVVNMEGEVVGVLIRSDLLRAKIEEERRVDVQLSGVKDVDPNLKELIQRSLGRLTNQISIHVKPIKGERYEVYVRTVKKGETLSVKKEGKLPFVVKDAIKEMESLLRRREE